MFNFFSKSSDVRDKIKDGSSLNKRPIKDCVKDIEESNDIFNGLNKFRENKPNIIPKNESVLISTENVHKQDHETSSEISNSKISPKKVI